MAFDHYLSQIGDVTETGTRPGIVNAANNGAFRQGFIGNKTLDAAEDDVIGLFKCKLTTVFSTLSHVAFTAFGSSVVLDVGVAADADLGISGKEAALASNIDVSGAGTAVLVPLALTAANMGKELWQVLGLSERSEREVWIIGTLQGANPDSGTIAIEQGFAV